MGTRGSEQGFARKERGLKGVGVHARREARERAGWLEFEGQGGKSEVWGKYEYFRSRLGSQF